MKSLEYFDPEIFKAIRSEAKRQENHIELIASENYASSLVLQTQGSVLTNKYAEGYPGKRYYGGCEHVDTAETLAIDRAKALFNAEYANVQPHSGSQANAAVYQALMNPGDTLVGLALDHGGHLTHGAQVNFSGKVYNAVAYGVSPKDELIDYDAVAEIVKKHKPRVLLGGFSAYSRICDWKTMRDIADSVGAYLIVDMAHIAGLVAADVYPSPLPYAHVVTSTTHKTLAGPRGGLILSNAGEDIYKKINSAVFPGQQGGPLMHVVASKAVAFREAMDQSFKDLQVNTIANAKAMANTLEQRDIRIVSGGTDCHMFLIDSKTCKLTGKEAEIILGRANITVNKNTIPNDIESPFITSGIRIGTPAITRRGFDINDAVSLAHWIADLLHSPNDDTLLRDIKDKVSNICHRRPVYETGLV